MPILILASAAIIAIALFAYFASRRARTATEVESSPPPQKPVVRKRRTPAVFHAEESGAQQLRDAKLAPRKEI